MLDNQPTEEMDTSDWHDFEDSPATAYLTYTTNQGFEIVCSQCDGEIEGHRDFVSDDAARRLYAEYEQR